jgi:hypothetical protein
VSLQDQLLPVAVTFLYGQGNLGQTFDASGCATPYGGTGDECVDLKPKTPTNDYKKVSLVVDAADGHVKESIILDASDNLNHFVFSDVRTNNSGDAATGLYAVDPNALSKKGIRINNNP